MVFTYVLIYKNIEVKQNKPCIEINKDQLLTI